MMAAEKASIDGRAERRTCSYENLSSRFLTQSRTFSQQYSQIYSVRLMELKPMLEATVRRKWGNRVKILPLMAVKIGQECVIMGTVFKKMVLKPSILKEISDEQSLLPPPYREKFADETDSLVLEDASQRISLTGAIDPQTAVTGAVLAARGVELPNGQFEVDDYTYCDIPPQPTVTLDEDMTAPPDKYVMMVSGMSVGEDTADQLALQLFLDLVTGQLGSDEDSQLYSRVVRVIVAGDSICNSRKGANESKLLTRKTDAGSTVFMPEVDQCLAQLASSVPTDVMPGRHDPCNYTMPQQPMHRCMFPKASSFATFQCVSNPYDCRIGGARFLGSSGQGVDNIFSYSTYDDRLSILEQTLRYGHILPTAPDTLGCYPFYKSDPFIIKECPTVFFAGSQSKFDYTDIIGSDGQRVLVVLVPRFAETSSAVLINLRTLDCQEIHFSTRLRLADDAKASGASGNTGDDDDEAMEYNSDNGGDDDATACGNADAVAASQLPGGGGGVGEQLGDVKDLDMDSPVDSQKVLVSSPNKEGMDLG
ncbi:DNA polymerase delta subunit 2-like [Sycon ciliatum]|uniref:DNA polymerase delta subunit 2-like n=1 Tax=Sycon ciliatum TaxID=27933 RepID=UPI0020A8CCDF